MKDNKPISNVLDMQQISIASQVDVEDLLIALIPVLKERKRFATELIRLNSINAHDAVEAFELYNDHILQVLRISR